jgi:hypothetical protein
MKSLFLFLFLLFQVYSYGQIITNNKGERFDITTIPYGSIVEYNFYSQGIFAGRTISVDGVTVFNFKNWRKATVLINGVKQNNISDIGIYTMLIKFFSQQGFTSFSNNTGQQIIPGGDNTYLRNTANQTWIKNN